MLYVVLYSGLKKNKQFSHPCKEVALLVNVSACGSRFKWYVLPLLQTKWCNISFWLCTSFVTFFWSSLTAGHASPRGLGDWTVGARLSRWMDMWQPALLIIVSVSHPDDLRIQLVCICVRGWFWMECNTMCFQNPGIIEKGRPPPAHSPCPF